ncbi:putative isopentenyl-diphosphate delta-isomerase [Pedobacter sp. BAL39]|uniref:isopentenyl-diphosphate Delta-isomerase n=1 Tax=Pedobacter sp. BAL39 TaxID=391596 RepID=UPI000155951B|nr:isopentenyl-diphosphate Delta-isomerase [Pedobacter sp. BAL39]EDM36687.1 putative isopentenyl-diphosphate delta-isomerase [Pedobacter sp. BAL39]
MTEHVILVDADDVEVGTMPKMEAHLEGRLHRAFSVFIFNSGGELLLQRRALEKYHSGGKWTNTCCSHPREGEDTLLAAQRRLMEEMGMIADLNHEFSFLYKAELSNGLTEHEYDHVFFGISDQVPDPDPEEVADFRYLRLEVLQEELNVHPEQYTEWLKICFDRVLNSYSKIF